MPGRLQDLEHVSIDDVNAALLRNDPAELRLVSITLALIFSDCSFVEDVCIKLSSHLDEMVRGNAVTSLGYLARRFRKLDKRLVKPVIEHALLDDNEEVRELAHAAANEIHQFLHWDIKGHVYG